MIDINDKQTMELPIMANVTLNDKQKALAIKACAYAIASRKRVMNGTEINSPLRNAIEDELMAYQSLELVLKGAK